MIAIIMLNYKYILIRNKTYNMNKLKLNFNKTIIKKKQMFIFKIET